MLAIRTVLCRMAVAFAVIGGSGLARAEPTAASRAFDQGLAHYRDRDYAAAAKAFFRAYELASHVDSAYNAALAWELAGDRARAATAFELVLGMEPEAKTEADCRERLARLANELGRVEVSLPDGATLRLPPFVSREPHPVIYLEPGAHVLRITLRSGKRVDRRVTARVGRSAAVVVEEAEPEADEPPEPERAAAPAPAPESTTPWRTLGYVSLGAAGVASTAAVILGLQTLQARDEYDASNHTDADARSRGITAMRWANVAWGAAAVTAATGVGILVLAPADGPTPAGAQVRVGGRF